MRGRLRVYLGAAPGVGKTFAMLAEGHRRASRGTDIAIGLVETHGRVHTAEEAEGLRIIGRRTISYRDHQFDELDVDAVILARPATVLIDELAHTNVPGSRNPKRWQDVDEILASGIDVVTTVNIQHLESLNDVVEAITGIRQRETVPDDIVRAADQIELVDMSPEALRRRMAHGNVYPAEKVDAALANYFRPGNLAALRELALLWLADRVDEGLEQYRADHKISQSWQARERVVVALSGGPEGETLLRRGARIAERGAGGELLALHVARGDGLVDASPDAIARQRQLTAELGGRFSTVVGDDVAEAVLEFARSVNASRIVVGVSTHNRWARLFRHSIGSDVIDGSGDIDVNVVTHELAHIGRASTRSVATGRRTRWGWALAIAGPPILTALLAGSRGLHSFSTELMLFLVLAVSCALVGGLWPAVVAAVGGSILLNYFFASPLYTLTIRDPQNAFALVVFVCVSAIVATVVGHATRRSASAARAQAEADALTGLADTLVRADDPLPALLGDVLTTFGMTAASVIARPAPHAPWSVLIGVGSPRLADPSHASAQAGVSSGVQLVAAGRILTAAEQRLFQAFAAHVSALMERARLAREASAARDLADANRIRTALLAAVSHDLRTPLASIKAAISSLRSPDVAWSDDDTAELMATVEDSADRLGALIDNLLDMSRLQSGATVPQTRTVGIDEVLPGALAGIPPDGRVVIEVPDDSPPVRADPGLLERVLANLIENAVRYSESEPVTVSVDMIADRVQVRIVDRGIGVAPQLRDSIFEPFQRLGDAPGASGVGLGLAVARGLTEAMGGTLTADDTPGGGLTMVVELPPALEPSAKPPAGGRQPIDARPDPPAGTAGEPTADADHPAVTIAYSSGEPG